MTKNGVLEKVALGGGVRCPPVLERATLPP